MFSERLTGEASLHRELEALSVSQRLVRSVSQKLRKKNLRGEGVEEDDSRGVSLKCLTLYGMGGGCKVGAETSEEFGDPSGRRRSCSASEEGKGYKPVCGNEETGFDCFSYGDDVLELCLVRLPLTSLMNARLDQWHRLDSDILKGRFMFSVASIQDDIYVVGGGLGSWDEPLDSGEIYDPASNKWTEIQRLPMDFGVVCSGVICNGIFYVYSETDKLMGYDIQRGFWMAIQTSPFPPRVHEYYPKLVSCNGQLFMLSVSWCEGEGQIGQRNKAVRKLWELDLMYLTWTEVSVHPDAPMDWNAAFVADKNLIFGVEMFKIFGQVLDFLTVCDVSNTGTNWSHLARNHMTHELDASSCMTKSLAVLHL
ncbi:hypothetical protein OIU78_012946 [Salix suchowensis]|nr:hypothetical protein OIU78_012946 [Salix suchowensis]